MRNCSNKAFGDSVAEDLRFDSWRRNVFASKVESRNLGRISEEETNGSDGETVCGVAAVITSLPEY